MNPSEMLMDFHAHVEGYRRDAYQDHLGKWTIGIGHANQATAPFQSGDVWDDDKIRDVWEKDVQQSAKIARRALGDCEVSQEMFDAVVDIIFNTGQVPNTMIKKLKAGDEDGAREQILRWIYAGGEPVLGLMRRRFAMYVYTLGDNWEDVLNARASSRNLSELNDVLDQYGYAIDFDDEGKLCWELVD